MSLVCSKFKTPLMVNSERCHETKAVYNPTVIKKDAKIYMLYRAESHNGITGTIGLAWSEDGIHFVKHPEPVLVPDSEYDEEGCEDPRVVAFDNTYYMSYVPKGKGANGTEIALAASSDLFHWTKLGLIDLPRSDWCSEKVKAPVIAPIRVNGKYVMYFMGQKRSWHSAVGVAYSDDLIHWVEDNRNPVLTPRYSHLDCLGLEPGATPILLHDQLVLFYNAWDETFTHRTWYSAFDMCDPGRLAARDDQPILTPEYSWECSGYVKNIIFTEGAMLHNNQLYLYYGASDTSIGLALCNPQHI